MSQDPVAQRAASTVDPLPASALMTAVRSGSWWGCVLSIALVQAGIALLNSTVFPLYNGIFLEARDIGTAVAAVTALALWVVLVRKPGVLRARLALAGNAAFLALGLAILFSGIFLHNAPLLLAGTVLRSVTMVWFSCIAMLALVDVSERVGKRGVFCTLFVAWSLTYLFEFALLSCPLAVQVALFCLMPFASCALAYRCASPVIDHALGSHAARDLRVTHPRSFLPLGHAIFITIVLLKMSFGFAMTFSSVDATPQQTVLACVPALAIALAFVLVPKLGLNGFYKATLLCVLAGYLLVNPLISAMTGMPALANVVLRAGSDLTRMLIYLVVAQVGVRNRMNAVNVALFISGANSLGSIVGAQLGLLADSTLSQDPGTFALLLAAVAFGLVAYNVLVPGNFELDGATDAIEPVVVPAPMPPTDTVSDACALISKKMGLTPREAEALELLAHGRNTQAIQERMVVSRSTAKTHVRNVYAKLDVHSQQDLIDMVERLRA